MTDQTHDFDLESANLDDFMTIDTPVFTVPSIRADDYSVTDDEDGDGYVFDHVRLMTAGDRDPSRFEGSLYNATMAISHDARTKTMFGFDDFRGAIVVRRPFVSEVVGVNDWKLDDPKGDMLNGGHVLSLQTWLQAPYRNPGVDGGYNSPVKKDTVNDAIENVAKADRFDSLMDSLEELVWDGKSRLSTFLHRHVGAPADGYHAAIFEKWCLGAVARAYEPGTKFDNILSIVGPQGSRKSTLAEVLGGAFFRAISKKAFDEPKKLIEQTQGSWIVELPENSALRGISDNDRKAMITATVDRDRMSYGKHAGDYARRWVMIITTNDRAFLTDPSGNRRYWVVTLGVEKIDIDAVQAERDQIWAEAVHIYKRMRKDQPVGMLPLHLEKDLEEVADAKQKMARMGDDIEDLVSSVRSFLETPQGASADGCFEVDGEFFYEELDKAEIWHGITGGQGGEFHNASGARKINQALSMIDYVSIKPASMIKRLGKKANKIIIDPVLFRKALGAEEQTEVVSPALVEEEFVAVAPGVGVGEDGQGVGGREEKSAEGMEMGGEAPAAADSFDDLEEQAPAEEPAPAHVEVKEEVAAPVKSEPAPAPKVVDQLDESPF